MYKSFSVWDWSEEGLYRYHVLENLQTGKYSALMRDFFGKKASIPKDLLVNFDKYFVELLVEMPPEDRVGAFDTIQDAIVAFGDQQSGNTGT
jgi:hypothetical protein